MTACSSGNEESSVVQPSPAPVTQIPSPEPTPTDPDPDPAPTPAPTNHIPTANPTISMSTSAVGTQSIRVGNIVAASNAIDPDGDLLTPTTDNPGECTIYGTTLDFKPRYAYVGE